MTPNAALDRTYHGSELALDGTHRAEKAHARVGGQSPEVARALRGAGVVRLAVDLTARSTVQQIEKSRHRPTPFAEAHGKASERVLPTACNQQMGSQADKEGER
jgi:fructose-1-phosphate kinase PfkB-like protein